MDFYLLGDPAAEAGNVACRLALMAWERNQTVFVIAPTESSAMQLDDEMWQYPQQRFLPHALAGTPESAKAAVNIGTLSSLNPADVVINLCPEAVPQPQRFSRVLEIVPYASDERKASRVKYKAYRKLGLMPETLETATPTR